MVDCQYLVIGSGIAGLSFALRVADFGRVVIVTKKSSVDTATNLAQGGIAAVLDENDSLDEHIEDTLVAGDGLCDFGTVKRVVSAGKDRVCDLMNYGVNFVKDSEGENLSLGREGGHSKRRVAHAYDLTGREIELALLEKVKKHKDIDLLEDHMAVDLIVAAIGGEARCLGAYVINNLDEVCTFRSVCTVLCTGGAGKVYLYTSNPDIATGDGVAIGYRAGAQVANMEFVQFHPTCLFHPRAKNFLISEAVRGEGAILVNHAGQRFMEKYDNRMELATRDMVARSIDSEMKESGDDCVFLDISHKPASFVKKRFPGIYSKCMEYGLDITKEPLPVVPAAHYLCGGVLVDEWGQTSLPGLMALGETSCTGLHGANRLASNSLLEAVVYAERAALYCKAHQERGDDYLTSVNVKPWDSSMVDHLGEEILINHNWDVLRRIMWNYVGIVRSMRRLNLAKQRLIEIANEIEELYRGHHVSKNMIELRNIAHIALMIVESARLRKESRGLHFCKDYPRKNESSRYWTVLTRDRDTTIWDFAVSRKSFTMNEKKA